MWEKGQQLPFSCHILGVQVVPQHCFLEICWMKKWKCQWMKEKSGNRSVWISTLCFCRPSLQPSSLDSVTWKANVYEPCHYLPSGGIQPGGNSYRREEGSLGWPRAVASLHSWSLSELSHSLHLQGRVRASTCLSPSVSCQDLRRY